MRKFDSVKNEPPDIYERDQDLNFITKFLHNNRNKNLISFMDEVVSQSNNKTIKILDIGPGLAKTFELLDARYDINYLGVELDATNYASIATKRYGNKDNFKIIIDSIEKHYDKFSEQDLIIGLETFEHIPESLVVRIIEAINESKVRYFYATVPNEI